MGPLVSLAVAYAMVLGPCVDPAVRWVLFQRAHPRVVGLANALDLGILVVLAAIVVGALVRGLAT